MEYNKLKDYYNRVDQCSITIQKDMDFDNLQEQITKLAIHIEDLNRVIGELLIEQTKLEHEVTNKKFEYELKFTEYQLHNSDVKQFTTSKERKDYINYFLMKDDYRFLVDKEQELRDVEKLLDLSKKKARDLDKTYPKLKTLWDSIQLELKYVKKMGSDSEYISNVKSKMDIEKSAYVPLFTDNIVEELIEHQYDNTSVKEDNLLAEFDTKSQKEVEEELEELLGDL